MVRADRALRTLHSWLAQTMPSYEAIAATAECCRDMVYEAIKVLEFGGGLTWTPARIAALAGGVRRLGPERGWVIRDDIRI